MSLQTVTTAYSVKAYIYVHKDEHVHWTVPIFMYQHVIWCLVGRQQTGQVMIMARVNVGNHLVVHLIKCFREVHITTSSV